MLANAIVSMISSILGIALRVAYVAGGAYGLVAAGRATGETTSGVLLARRGFLCLAIGAAVSLLLSLLSRFAPSVMREIWLTTGADTLGEASCWGRKSS